jgi:phenylalanyl-tRNA synthetase beta chain
VTQEQVDLAISGMRPLDFAVDWTNVMMLLTGQPLHAFDYDKLVKVGGTDKPKIVVRQAKDGEKMTLLDGRTIEMDANDIVVTSNDVPVALAGAMGGANTVIDENTKRIVVESATFSLYNLRRTQMKHGIFSEAVTRFTKGQPTELTRPVLCEFARRVQPDYEVVSQVFDEYPKQEKNPKIEVTAAEINGILGTDYSKELVERTLANVGFENWTAPWWRTDVRIKEDVVEEVGRLLGYDNIPLELPLRTAKAARKNALLELMSRVREILSSYGASEVLTYSFVHGDLLKKVGQDAKNSYRLVNSISPELELIRQSLMPSLLDKVEGNVRDGYERFALFEMNPKSQKSDGLTEEKVPVEVWKLALVYADVNGRDAFYQAKALLDGLLGELGVVAMYEPAEKCLSSTGKPFELKRAASVFAEGLEAPLAICGELRGSVRKGLALPEATAGFELDLDKLLGLTKVRESREESRYPAAERDLTLQVPVKVPYEKAAATVREATMRELWVKVTPTAIYQGGDAEYKNLTWHLEVASYEKTLTSEEVRAIMDSIGERAHDELGAKVV